MFTNPASILVAGGLLLAASSIAGSAAASENTNRQEVHFPTDEVVATCADGSDIGLGFDMVRNVHDTYNDAGELIKEQRTINYTGIFENLTSGERYTFRGTRIVTFDFENDLFFGRGNFRTVTMPAAGVVLHATGMLKETLEEGLLYKNAGPWITEWVAGPDAVCSLFGLAGA
jgi:hypothetical protein